MASNQTDDLASGILASLDTRGAVLEDEDIISHIGQVELLKAHAVAGRVGFAVEDGLGGDEVRGDGEVEATEPAVNQRLGARGDNGPRSGVLDHAVEKRACARNLRGEAGVEDGELALDLGNI